MGWQGHQRLHVVTRLLVLVLTVLCVPAAARPNPDIQYRVYTENLINHQLRVEAEFPPAAFPGKERVLALPVWTPGSYKVRDYSRFLREVKLADGRGRVEKISKNRWRVSGIDSRQPVRVSYSLYGRELTVRTNYFSPDLSLITGAGTFLAPAPLQSQDMPPRAFSVSFPDYQGTVHSALARLGKNSFRAVDYDELLDCPILFGKVTRHDFLAGGVPHSLLQTGDTRYWDLEKSLQDVTTLVEAQQKFWGQTPYQSYQFMNLVTDTRGGLEHRNSTVMMTSRFATRDTDKYRDWLSLVSHEFFHTWNVKRLRPKALGPFDYEKEIYTRSLWVAEGITSYYDDLLVRRAGLCTDKQYYKALGKQLNRLANTPGRKALPLTNASLDAWIRLYQPTEDSINSSISYYNKGAIVAWLLDTEIQRQTEGRKSLDDVMRAAYQRFQKVGFEEAEFRALCEKVSGAELTEFFALTLDSTQELPVQAALDYWGLEWKVKDSEASQTPHLGAEAPAADGRLVVTKVLAGSPAAQAGVSPGDELLALDGIRIPADGLKDLVESLELSTPYPLLVSRLGLIHTLQVSLRPAPFPKSSLKVKEESGPFSERRARWLGGDST